MHHACMFLPNLVGQGHSQDFRKEGARLRAKRAKIFRPETTPTNKITRSVLCPLNSPNIRDSRPDTARSRHSSKVCLQIAL